MVSRKWARSAEHGTVRTAGPAARQIPTPMDAGGPYRPHRSWPVDKSRCSPTVQFWRGRGTPWTALAGLSWRFRPGKFLRIFILVFLSFCLLIRFYKKPPISFSFFWSRYNNLHILVNTIYTIKPLSDSANYCHLERHCNSRWHQCWHHQKWLREPGRPPRMNWKNGWEGKM